MGLSTYPNPSPDGNFTVRAPGLKTAATVRVLDGLGRQVLAQRWAAPQLAPLTLDLSGQVVGVYVVELATSEGLVRRKLVVR